MPWCPKCKNEYREGMTKCADCGELLVEKLENTDDTEYTRLTYIKDEKLAEKFVAYMEYSKLPARYEYSEEIDEYCILVRSRDKKRAVIEYQAFIKVEAENKAADIIAAEADDMNGDDVNDENAAVGPDSSESEDMISENSTDENESTEASAEETCASEEKARKSSGVYVKKADTAKDMNSTAVTFFVFSLLLLAFAVLNMLNIIPYLTNNIPGLILLFALAVACCLVGFNALKRAKKASEDAVAEEAFTATLNEWMEKNISIMTDITVEPDSTENGDAADDTPDDDNENDTDRETDGNSIELLYLNRSSAMKEAITQAFGELDESYLDCLIDEFYDKHF